MPRDAASLTLATERADAVELVVVLVLEGFRTEDGETVAQEDRDTPAEAKDGGFRHGGEVWVQVDGGVSADTIGEFEVLGCTIAAGGSTGTTAMAHSSEECSIVLSGRVVAEVAGRTYELDAGDSIKVHRELPHRFVNPGTVDAEMLIIISPPTF